jgi:hypothetical protein
VDNCTLTNPNTVSLLAIKIFPNPTKNNITVQIPDNIILQNILLYNTTGQKIDAYFDTINSKLDISKLSSGIYFIEIMTDFGVEIVKIQKLNE